MIPLVVIFSFDPRRARPCRHAPCPDKSLPLNLFADPHPLNPYATIFYKKGGGRGIAFPTCKLSDIPTLWFSVHSSKFRIPQLLCLPLLRKLPGVTSYQPKIPLFSTFFSSSTFRPSDLQTFFSAWTFRP